MRIIDGDKKTTIPRDTYYADAIRSIIKAFERKEKEDDNIPERNDVKRLWPHLQDGHKELLHVIARQGTSGVIQSILQDRLDISSEKLRGIHNGLARISKGLDIENPVNTSGYNKSNRRYYLDASAAKTVISLWKREH